MSCKRCEAAQDNHVSQLLSGIEPTTFYVRIEEADVQLIGCSEHLKVVLDRLRTGTPGWDNPEMLGNRPILMEEEPGK